jgi:hypothetical protein
VVSPNAEVFNVSKWLLKFLGKLIDSSVVVKSGHGREVLLWNSLCVVGEDEAVGVGWVSDDNDFNVSVGVISNSFSLSNEDLAVILKKVSSFHTWASWFSSDEEGVVGILETS